MRHLPNIWFDRAPDPKIRAAINANARLTWPTADDPLKGVAEADGIIAGASLIYDRSVFSTATKVRVLCRAGIGFDNVVIADATESGVMACNTPDGPTVSTAEHAIALILSLSKRLKESESRLARQEGNYASKHNALELAGARITLIGLGRIGSHVCKIASAIGMNVTAFDPYESEEKFQQLKAKRSHDLMDSVRNAQIVSIHAPLSEATHHLINGKLIQQMADGVIIVNTSRGALIDDQALLQGLDEGKVGSAGLDVTEPEPLPANHPFLERENVLITPHVASATVTGRRRIFLMAVEEILAALGGGRPSNLLNPEVLKHKSLRG